MRHMHVLGVDLQDYSVREAMRKTDYFLRDNKVSTIAYITTRGLMAAEESPELRAFLSDIDLTVAADSDILRVAGVDSRNRIKEIENDEFMEEFLKKLVRGKRRIYLLTGTEEQLQALDECLKSYQANLRIVGKFSLDRLEKDEDYLINEMNGLMPDVVISNISSPQRETFFAGNHMKMNARIWLMLKDKVVHATRRKDLFWKIGDKLSKKLFQRKVEKYQNQGDDSGK
ncbi:MAG: WecB/TagA/CpsF family glycosyltransferase [Lachnospiraceae bacterium]|nr:WecB/TagA/CpsF family glycosyltransferase [Lachnospiraceae bacterium]